MKLTDTAVRNAKPDSQKSYKLFDGRGLYLLVTRTGRKGWRFKFRFAGKENSISLGVYPDVSLKSARERSQEARELLAQGIDPSKQRKKDKLGIGKSDDQNTFKAVGQEWFGYNKNRWTEKYQVNVLRMLEQKLYPWIGDLPVAEVTASVLLSALRKTETTGRHESAMRAKQIAGQVLRYASITRQSGRDVTPDLKGQLTTPKPKHMAAIIEPKKLGRLMLAIDNYEGSPEVCAALRFSLLTFARPGEIRHAEWSEINWNESLWCIDASKMKKERDHIVPLSRQAIKVLQDIHPFTKDYKYIFPNGRTPKRPMSENAVRIALRTMGYKKDEVTPHGFRATARTLLDQELDFKNKWIERQLAHKPKGALGEAYDRAQYLDKRTGMMQAWADYLDKLRTWAETNTDILISGSLNFANSGNGSKTIAETLAP